MSDQATTEWVESVLAVLEDMCTDIQVFHAALKDYDQATLVDKFGEYLLST